jgi:hypothetical protein
MPPSCMTTNPPPAAWLHARCDFARPSPRQMHQSTVVATHWLYPFCGFVVGAIVGLTGMGGGALMTPLLILLFGVHPLTAVGTDLLYAAVTKAVGTAIHSKRGNVDWRVAGLLAAGSIPATVLTIWVLSEMPKQSATTATIISMSVGVALIIAAAAIFFRRRIRDLRLGPRGQPDANAPLGRDHRGLRCGARRARVAVLGRCRCVGRSRALSFSIRGCRRSESSAPILHTRCPSP